MDFMVNIEMKKLAEPITYRDKILLIGSCFTEHIGNALMAAKFSVLQNPNGILFDPASVSKSLQSYMEDKRYSERDLFQLNETWASWQHHSRFSNFKLADAINGINESQKKAHDFLRETTWIIITLGSAFSYQLSEEAKQSLAGNKDEISVANCHRAPAQWFRKHLMEIEETSSMLDGCYKKLKQFNPGVKIIFTVSPVRHIRDGVVENNRSKARLLEVVHRMVNVHDDCHYFPAYELVIDVLRDYRFFDSDLVHPNYMATEFVLEKFSEYCIDRSSQLLMEEIKKIGIARRHRSFQPETAMHKEFLKTYFEKVKTLKDTYPFLELNDELGYFSGC